MTPSEYLRILAWCWVGHGVGIILLIGLAWIAAPIDDAAALWAELGMAEIHSMLTHMLAVITDCSVPLSATGLLCVMGGLLLLRWPTPGRYLLHLAALLHIVGIPWITWLILAELHQLGHPILHAAISAVIVGIGTLIGVVASSIVMERCCRAQSAALHHAKIKAGVP